MNQIVLNGNNIDLLKNYPDNYFDAVVTDPPYGLGKEPNAEALMKDWIEKGYHEISGTGFMGKEWDSFVPQPIFWKEVFRVLKYGGHVVSFFGTRTYDWGVMAMRFAGFEVRDCIQWLYGSGFPKSHNISKAIDKINGANVKVGKGFIVAGEYGDINLKSPEKENYVKHFGLTEEAKQWDGWGSALKPANEPIVLARKPLEKGLSIAENVLKWGTGGINIDGFRVGNKTKTNGGSPNINDSWIGANKGYVNGVESAIHNYGRFPANLILTHHPECECVGTKKVKGVTGGENEFIAESKFGQISGNVQKPFHYADENGEETIEDWNCHEDCPIRILDEQSGQLKSGSLNGEYHGFGNNGIYGKSGTSYRNYQGDKGGASRFFYCAKASKSERNKGLEGFEEKQSVGGGGGIGDYIEDINSASGKYGSEKAPNKNFHPTVKPIKLMQYLAKLITPPNGIVLDPFCGSGTTGVACKLEGFEFVGMEQDAEYTKIAEARINNHIDEKDKVEPIQKDNREQLSLF